jgi:hypothetical protein
MSAGVKEADNGDARSWDLVEEVEEVLAMLGRLGRRDNDEGLKERLVMVVVLARIQVFWRSAGRLEFWRWRRLSVTSCDRWGTEGLQMIRRTDLSPCDITPTGR